MRGARLNAPSDVSDPVSAKAHVAHRALDWIYEHLDCFEPFQGNTKPQELKLKAIDELALLCLCLQRLPMFSEDPRVREFLQFLRGISRIPLIREATFRIPNGFVLYSYLTVVSQVSGDNSDEEYWQRVQKLIEHSNVTYTERPAFRMLDLRYLLDLGQFAHNVPSYKALYRNTILSKPLNPIYVTDAEAYSITHALFYLGDFGSCPISIIPSSHTNQICWLVEILLGMYLHTANWDLAGELLLSCHCLGRTTSEFYALGWHALKAAQWPDGAVPGPAYDANHGQDSQQERVYIFDKCYHTTLVAALAGAVCCAPHE